MTSFKRMFSLAVFISLAVHMTVLATPMLLRSRVAVQDNMGVVTVELRKSESTEMKMVQMEQEKPRPSPPEADHLQKTTPSREETITLGSREPKYQDYLRKVKSRIERRWTYPGKAFARGERGVTTVRFSISAGGSLVSNNVMGSSGYGLLDQTALNVIQAAAPYDPLPREFNLSRLNIIADFHYSLGR